MKFDRRLDSILVRSLSISSQWRHNWLDNVSDHQPNDSVSDRQPNDYSSVHLGADQRKHQSSASQAFVRGIHRGPVNSPHKEPVTRKMFPFDEVIMFQRERNSEHKSGGFKPYKIYKI